MNVQYFKSWVIWIALLVLTISASAYSPRLLNQMLGWTCGETNALFAYDANGNRDRKFITVGGATASATEYGYDEDNRLVLVVTRDTEIPKEYKFGYDYRTRRISRETPTEKTIHVFNGGLSVQEYDASDTPNLTPNNLTTESIRGEGMGGGVGGMVYSVRNGQVEASHSNHRGDVFARTDGSGKTTWSAAYRAYGTRLMECGATHDRQRGNTKDEETPLGFINDGMRPRSLAHGCYLTRDPAGYIDGPNLYCYVRNNPITQFDPLGLETVRAKFQRANVMPLYHAWNFLSFGTLGKNDRLVERMESGEISVGQWQAGSVGNGGVALASVAAGGGAASLGKAALVKGAAAGFAGTATEHLGTEAIATGAGYGSEQDGGALKVAAGTATGAVVAPAAKYVSGKLSQTSNPQTETVQRWMSKAELKATKETGLLRGGRGGRHYATDSANNSVTRARQRSALKQTPEVRATLEVPEGKFSKPSKVKPKYNMPGGGTERTAKGKVPVKVLKVDGGK